MERCDLVTNGRYREAWELALQAASDYPDDLRDRLLDRLVKEAGKADKWKKSRKSKSVRSLMKPIKRLVKALYGKP